MGPTISTSRIVKLPSEKSFERALSTAGVTPRHSSERSKFVTMPPLSRVARIGELLRELVVAISGIRTERKRILLREIGGEGRGRNGIEIRLTGRGGPERLVKDIENGLFARIERLIALSLLLEADYDVVLRTRI